MKFFKNINFQNQSLISKNIVDFQIKVFQKNGMKS